jgi:hypothetical protein
VVWPDAWDDDESVWNGAEAPRAKPVDPGPVPHGYEDAVSAFMEATGQRKPAAKSR